MIKCLFDGTGEWIDMCDWCSDVVSDIRNNNDRVGIRWGVEDKIVKFATIDSFAFLVAAISFVK